MFGKLNSGLCEDTPYEPYQGITCFAEMGCGLFVFFNKKGDWSALVERNLACATRS